MTTSAQAKERLAAATSTVALARTEVADAREAVSVGEATQKDVARATKALQRAQDREEQARVDLAVVTRREAQEAAIAADEADRVQRELRMVYEARRAAELQRWREFLLSVKATARGFDQRLRVLSNDLREQGAAPIPSRWSSWIPLFEMLDHQLQHLPLERTNKEA
jgi:phage protein D